MTHLLLEFTLAEDYLERRGQFRAAHLALLEGPIARGELLLAGALPDPFDRSVFLWREDAREVAEEFIAADPYGANGLTTGWTIRTWNTVAGALVAE